MKNQDSKNSKNDKRRVFWQVHLDAWRDTGLTQPILLEQLRDIGFDISSEVIWVEDAGILTQRLSN